MASPFVDVATRLGGRVAPLAPRAQVLFFACAGKVLWPERTQLFEEALSEGFAFASTGSARVDLQSLLARTEREAPEAPIAAQDAWICADIALRVACGGFHAADGMWYVLEPQFQATSERLFGYSDVGSEREQEDEARALEDTVLARAIAGVETALEHLRAVGAPGDTDAGVAIRHLLPIQP